MAQQNLLTIVQNILSAIDSDQVNSIGDTVEALQVAKIVQNKYYDIQTRAGFPSQKVLFQLNASGDITKPVQMQIPAGTSHIEWLKYYDASTADSQQQDQFGSFSHGLNTDLVSSTSWVTTSSTSNLIGLGTKTFTVASSTLPIQNGQGVIANSGTNSMFGNVTSYAGTTLVLNVVSFVGSGTFASWTLTNASVASVAGYKYVNIIPIDQFLDMVNRFNPSDNNVASYTFTEGGENFTFLYKTNRQPKYCTVIENTFVLFDSYNNLFDSTLQASKTLLWGYTVSPFSLTDTFVPDMDDNEFPLLLNEAKILAFYELKQMPHPIADKEVKRQWNTIQKNKSKDNKPSYFDQLPDMGRVPRTGGYSGGGYGAYKWMRQT